MNKERASIVFAFLMFLTTSLSRNAVIAYVPTTISRSTGRYFGDKQRSHENIIIIGGRRRQIIQKARISSRLYSCDDLRKMPFTLECADTELQYVCEQQYHRLHHRTSPNTIDDKDEDGSNNILNSKNTVRRNNDRNNLVRKPKVVLLYNTVSCIQRRVRNVVGKRVFQRAFQSIFHDWELNEASIALLSRNFV